MKKIEAILMKSSAKRETKSQRLVELHRSNVLQHRLLRHAGSYTVSIHILSDPICDLFVISLLSSPEVDKCFTSGMYRSWPRTSHKFPRQLKKENVAKISALEYWTQVHRQRVSVSFLTLFKNTYDLSRACSPRKKKKKRLTASLD